MSLISTRSRYGLRLLVDLVESGASGPIDLGSIAGRQGIPEAYLAKLVQPLRNAGILRSARGAKGGYELAKQPVDISLLSVVEVLEGPLDLLDCTSSPSACEKSADCTTQPLWSGLERAIRDYLAAYTLADAAKNRSLDYAI